MCILICERTSSSRHTLPRINSIQRPPSRNTPNKTESKLTGRDISKSSVSLQTSFFLVWTNYFILYKQEKVSLHDLSRKESSWRLRTHQGSVWMCLLSSGMGQKREHTWERSFFLRIFYSNSCLKIIFVIIYCTHLHAVQYLYDSLLSSSGWLQESDIWCC